jgi:hypothetical protein
LLGHFDGIEYGGLEHIATASAMEKNIRTLLGGSRTGLRMPKKSTRRRRKSEISAGAPFALLYTGKTSCTEIYTEGILAWGQTVARLARPIPGSPLRRPHNETSPITSRARGAPQTHASAAYPSGISVKCQKLLRIIPT